MSYELSYRHEPDYLHIQATGVRTIESIVSMAKDLLAVRDEHGYSKVLLDVRGMVGGLGTIAAYKLGSDDIQEFRRPGQLKLSIIDLKENRERFDFFENVAVNAGLNLRIFADVDKAMAWLGVTESSASE